MDDLLKLLPQSVSGYGGYVLFAIGLVFFIRDRLRKSDADKRVTDLAQKVAEDKAKAEREASEKEREAKQREEDDRRFRTNTDYTIKYLQEMIKRLTDEKGVDANEFRRLTEEARCASVEYERELIAEIQELTRKCAGYEATLMNKKGAVKT